MTLPRWAVERLRERLVRCQDLSLTDQEREDERYRLVGSLDYHLNERPGE